jgi:hypothetical protein
MTLVCRLIVLVKVTLLNLNILTAQIEAKIRQVSEIASRLTRVDIKEGRSSGADCLGYNLFLLNVKIATTSLVQIATDSKLTFLLSVNIAISKICL